MAKRGETRRRVLEAARDLFQERGYHGVGINEILRRANAPAGSLYFHFPGGKQQLAAEAIASAGGDIAAAIEEGPGSLKGYFGDLGHALADSEWRRGCPITTVTLDVASDSPEVRGAAAEGYGRWHDAIAARLRDGGLDEAEASRRALLVLAATQGALVVARAWQDTSVLDTVADQLIETVLSAQKTSGGR